MKRFLYLREAILFSMVLFAIGCGGNNESSRREQAFGILESLRRDVDLNGPATPDVLTGESMPRTMGVDINGQSIDLCDHRGKVILLSFWGGG